MSKLKEYLKLINSQFTCVLEAENNILSLAVGKTGNSAL